MSAGHSSGSPEVQVLQERSLSGLSCEHTRGVILTRMFEHLSKLMLCRLLMLHMCLHLRPQLQLSFPVS